MFQGLLSGWSSLSARLVSSSAALAAVFSPLALHGAGFAIAEQSVSGLGYGFAGSAAIAEDSSTAWFNPAGMTELEGLQLQAGLHFILPSAEFTNTGTLSADPVNATYRPTVGADSESDTGAMIPNLYATYQASEDFTVGFSVNAPFGLKTKYADGWVGRYVAIESDLKTINVNPSVAWKISDQLSVAGGVSFVRADAVLSNAVDFGLVLLSQLQPNGPIPPTALPTGLVPDIVARRGTVAYDGFLRLEGDDQSYGWNLGILWKPSEATKIGVHYRSRVDFRLDGAVDFTLPTGFEPILGASFADQGGKVDLTLPSSLSVSLTHDLTDRFTILADVTWTEWEVFESLVIEYENGVPPNSVIPENWGNTMRYSVGGRFQLNEAVTLRAGLVVDEAAVPDSTYRSPRIPDADRFWVAFGGQWAVSESIVLDFGYAHIFVEDSTINNNLHTPGQILVGEMDSAVDIVSVSGTYRF
jgi:long-chain fatty acid transport protein